MEETIARIIDNMVDRVSGPMKFRMVIQPLIASVFAIIAGLKDAKAGNPPYFWALFTDAAHRKDLAKDGWKSVGKIFIVAALLDIVYQLIVQRWVYPFEVILVAFILAILPYLILRGLVGRLASRK